MNIIIRHIINPIVILHVCIIAIYLPAMPQEVEILFLDREVFLVYCTYLRVLGRQRAWSLRAQSVGVV